MSDNPKPPVPALFYHLCRILLGLLFVAASFEKIERPWDFGRAIYVYELLTGPLGYLISPVAIVMPLLEFACGALLIINRWVRPAALLLMGLNVVFIIAIASVMARGMDIACGCGLDVGIMAFVTGTQADAGALVRDLIIVVINLVVLFSPQSSEVRTG